MKPRRFVPLFALTLACGLSAVFAEDEKPKWDVDAPPGPSSDATLDTSTGTWMNLDVSPDGTEVVFDLLGDLYTVAIGGGEAKALTSGIAWDMQPRFSPDGEHIAFTSDRAGGDNLWIMNRDGSDPQQVTRETFRLVNSPAWTPDGQFLAAHKHFSSTRSLGSGEIWLYHRSGGSGVQMTEKPNDQKDVGEPVFSPDGRYLYFSQDTTPGSTFQYNKDPNGQIYEVRRLDRDTGRIVDLVGGPGGAVRPTPSRDGKQLAFVRRVRGRSTLWVRDLDSGRERQIWNGLERDMQETWAIHGVYPTMAWMPDDREIVVWASGRIHRVEVASGAVREIPFHVADTRRVAEALRFPIEVAPDTFPVKMLRWVSVSPQGDRVVYEALGRLWIRDLPNGTPRRLTSDDEHQELYPSWSRDGRRIVYVTWHDEELGAVRIVDVGVDVDSADGVAGAGRRVTERPGHYREPALSPDGETVVYVRGTGGGVVSPLYSDEPGLYAIPASGGDAELIARGAFGPHFGAASDRVYFGRVGAESKRTLVSVGLDGGTDSAEREHATSARATEFHVSPDGRWLAFREAFDAWITPFPHTGKAIEVGPEMKSLPVAEASGEAGEYLHWSGDSTRLHWALGPELFERDLTGSFAFLDGAPDELPEPPSAGLAIGFEAEADVPEGKVAIVGGRVVTMRPDADGNTEEVIENGTVLIEGNRIVAVGRRGEVDVPSDAFVLEARGHTVMPGLVDVHWHGSMGNGETVPQTSALLYSSLAFGVTTAHDPSNDTSTIFAASEQQRVGRIVGPRIFSTGTILYGAEDAERAKIDSLEDARFHVGRMKAVGAFSVKSYNQPRRDQRQQVIAAARELEMMVVPEGGSLFQHNMTMVVDGHTGIEHAIPVAKVYDDVLQLWSQTEVGYTPTLVVAYGGIWGENYWYQHTNVWDNERLQSFVPPLVLEARSRRRVMAPEDEYNHIDAAHIAKQLEDLGVGVQIGAHGQREGLGAHWEIWGFEQGGMTPHQALKVATLNGAKYLGLDGDIGSLEVGKLADVIVIAGNPLEDIRSSERVRYTVLNGRVYDAATMNEIGNRERARGAFWWEE